MGALLRALGWTGLAVLIFSVANGAGPTAHYRTAANGMRLPDASATPGVVALSDQKKVCATTWGKDARHVSEAMKEEVYAAYGAVKKKDVCCEVDHLVSRELGGADDLRNLWPQPWAEAHLKDRVENFLHRKVCGGQMTLRAAQETIRTDWTTVLPSLPK